MAVSAEVVALIAAAVAVFSAVLAVRATALVARTVLANDRNRAMTKAVTATVLEGHTRRDLSADSRDYAFVVSVANTTETDRNLGSPTLRVTYRTRANFIGAVDVSSQDAVSVAAGATATPTLRFTTSNVIPRHCRIDTYTLLFIDDRGARLCVDASLPAVLQADSDGTGPATWGWD